MSNTSPARTVPAITSSPDPLDPSDLGALSVPPLVPEEILRKYNVLVPTDPRFRGAARLLQACWRQDRELPIGSYVNAEGKRVRLGSRITEAAGKQGGNFLTPEIATLVRREAVFREIGAMIEVERLRENLLSSMPLTFNVFSPLKLNLRQATRFIAELFPGFMEEVVAIRFEHSPGRGNDTLTGDYSAFDVAFYGLAPNGERAMIGFEIKYSESGAEPSPSRISDRQLALAASGGLFKSEDPALFGLGLQQLTREHNLAQSMLERGIVDTALFVLAAPRLNHTVQAMGSSYARHLNPPQPGHAGFINLTLERLLEALVSIGMVEHARALHRRYLDFHLVEGELELDAAEIQLPKKPKRKTASEAAAGQAPA